MASNFPSSLDAFTNPSSSDAMDSVSVPHATQHSDLNDAVEALQAKVGADSSAVTSSHDYKIAQLEAGATGGKILQVVSTTKTDTFSAAISGGNDTAITGLSATITPTSASSTILVLGMVNGGGYGTGTNGVNVRTYRGATMIGVASSFGNRTEATASSHGGISGERMSNVGILLTDSPATTSATTYAFHLTTYIAGASQTYYVNRSGTDTDNSGFNRTISSITVMEVSA